MKNRSGGTVFTRSHNDNLLTRGYCLLRGSLLRGTSWRHFCLVLPLFVFFYTAMGMPQKNFAASKLTYDINVIGLKDQSFDKIQESFNAASLLKTQKSSPLVSIANLRGQIKSDVELMKRILRSEGYYDGLVFEMIARRDNHFKIDLRVTPAKRYTVGTLKTTYQGVLPTEDIRRQIEDTLKIKSGAPATAEAVVTAEAMIATILPKLGFPFAKQIERDLVVDHRSQTMNVTFLVNTGIRRHMGTAHFNGLKSVKKGYVTKLIEWQQGDIFSQGSIDKLRERLLKAGLFDSVRIEFVPASPDLVDIVISLTEAKHRTIGIAGGYSTAEGFSSEISWQHANFLKSGNNLDLIARVSEIEQSLSSRLEIPHFSRLDQTLSFEGIFNRKNTDAYTSHGIIVNAGLDRIITSEFALFTGVELEYSDITEVLSDRKFYLAALPIGARWDSSDDLLDPHRGFRASILTAPSIAIDGSQFTFLKSEFRTSAYYPVLKREKVILAARARLGSIVGTSSQNLPATRRYYAGGGGSIRGYAFQQVGPRAFDDSPLGGRSVTELALEARWKIMHDISLVPFIEGGNVYEDSLPKFNNFQWSAGLGARYHTSFGPVRFDVALPLNRRPGDSHFQFYISLGQAF